MVGGVFGEDVRAHTQEGPSLVPGSGSPAAQALGPVGKVGAALEQQGAPAVRLLVHLLAQARWGTVGDGLPPAHQGWQGEAHAKGGK